MEPLKTTLSRLEEGVVGLLLVVITLMVFVEVVLRFGFNTGVLWIEEVTLYLGGWFVLVGASYALGKHAHIAVDAVVRLLGTRARQVTAFIAVVLSIAYCVLLLVGSYEYLSKLARIGIEMEDVPIPRWMGQSMLAVGFGLLLVRLIFILVDVVKGNTTPFSQTNEAEEALEWLHREEGSDQSAKENDK